MTPLKVGDRIEATCTGIIAGTSLVYRRGDQGRVSQVDQDDKYYGIEVVFDSDDLKPLGVAGYWVDHDHFQLIGD